MAPTTCGGAPLTVKFYDVGQGLAVLVHLPDGRRVLVDTGEMPKRPGCGPCEAWSARLLDELGRDLDGSPLDTLWITHQHADHNGNADAVLRDHAVARYIDNGTRTDNERVKAIHTIAAARGVAYRVVSPETPESPWPRSRELRLTPVVPPAWPANCERHPNDCSIGLRIDYCHTSVLFTGDAEAKAEQAMPIEPVTLLQVAHHGSRTSTTPGFLERAQPQYAVISSAKRGEGTNATYCHPVAETVERLNATLGDVPAPGTADGLWAFVGTRCSARREEDWAEVPTSRRLFSTARDGHVTLTSTGDGTFTHAR